MGPHGARPRRDPTPNDISGDTPFTRWLSGHYRCDRTWEFTGVMQRLCTRVTPEGRT